MGQLREFVYRLSDSPSEPFGTLGCSLRAVLILDVQRLEVVDGVQECVERFSAGESFGERANGFIALLKRFLVAVVGTERRERRSPVGTVMMNDSFGCS